MDLHPARTAGLLDQILARGSGRLAKHARAIDNEISRIRYQFIAPERQEQRSTLAAEGWITNTTSTLPGIATINARKYVSNSQRAASIQAQRRENDLYLTVTDGKVGLKVEEAEAIRFDVFRRVQAYRGSLTTNIAHTFYSDLGLTDLPQEPSPPVNHLAIIISILSGLHSALPAEYHLRAPFIGEGFILQDASLRTWIVRILEDDPDHIIFYDKTGTSFDVFLTQGDTHKIVKIPKELQAIDSKNLSLKSKAGGWVAPNDLIDESIGQNGAPSFQPRLTALITPSGLTFKQRRFALKAEEAYLPWTLNLIERTQAKLNPPLP